ncbi:MAG: amino acid permease, partial [Acidimicrobiales bacterium]
MSSPPEVKLRRGLNIWQVVGLSVALMAPSMAANINPQGAASAAGRAVPLAFLLAAIGVMFVAYVFVRLTQYFNHSGSVFAFVGAMLGPRAGLIAGWSLMGTYMSYGLVTSIASSIFATSLLQSLGIWSNPPTWAPFLLAAFELVLVWYVAIRPARNGTRFLLTVEGTTVALIVPILALGLPIF